MRKPVIPNQRMSKFFSEHEFENEISMMREHFEGDLNMVVILYRVDRVNTASDALYSESNRDDIKYFPPVELSVFPILDVADNKSYNSGAGSLRYLQDGKLTFGVFDALLTELDTDILYGDYIGYPVSKNEIRYFTVANDGKKNYDNEHTLMGYQGYYRTIVCVATDDNEFRAV